MSANKYWWENGRIQQCTKLRDCRRFLHIICVLFQNNKRDCALNYAWFFEKEFLIFRNSAPHSKWFNLIQSLLAGHSLFSKAHHLWKLWPEIDVSSTESIRLLAVSYWLVKGVLCFVITNEDSTAALPTIILDNVTSLIFPNPWIHVGYCIILFFFCWTQHTL